MTPQRLSEIETDYQRWLTSGDGATQVLWAVPELLALAKEALEAETALVGTVQRNGLEIGGTA